MRVCKVVRATHQIGPLALGFGSANPIQQGRLPNPFTAPLRLVLQLGDRRSYRPSVSSSGKAPSRWRRQLDLDGDGDISLWKAKKSLFGSDLAACVTLDLVGNSATSIAASEVEEGAAMELVNLRRR